MMLPAGKGINSYLTEQPGPTFSSGLSLKGSLWVPCDLPVIPKAEETMALNRKDLPGI